MAEAVHNVHMGLPTDESGNFDIGVGGGVDVHPTLPEYHHPVYCHSYDTRAMSGGRVKYGSVSNTAMVGVGRNQLWARGWEGGGADTGFGGRGGE